MNLLKTGIASLLLMSVASTSMARGHSNSDKSGYKCTYYNDFEYIQENKKTFYYGEASSKKAALFKAKTKCKLGARKLQRKYNNHGITSRGCLTYPNDANACRAI